MSKGTPRIALVTGSLPPHDVCGVGDYTFRLHEALTEIYPVDLVHLPLTKKWEPKLFRLRRDYDLIHIQYPTEGWGNSLLPSAFPLSRKGGRLVLTLHEWSQMNRFRRASIRPLVKEADALVFVTQAEMDAYGRKLKRPKPSRVIPIGVNLKFDHDLARRDVLEVREALLASNRYDMLLTHFGFIHAGKQPIRLLETLDKLRQYGRRPCWCSWEDLRTRSLESAWCSCGRFTSAGWM